MSSIRVKLKKLAFAMLSTGVEEEEIFEAYWLEKSFRELFGSSVIGGLALLSIFCLSL